MSPGGLSWDPESCSLPKGSPGQSGSYSQGGLPGGGQSWADVLGLLVVDGGAEEGRWRPHSPSLWPFSRQKWLASPFPSSAFSPGGLVPEISQVEVLEKDSKATQLFLQQRDKGALPPSPTASCFTNQGYFFFHLLDALEIEACQVYFTYDPCEQEESEEAVPGTPMGSPLPLLPTVSGEDDAYCTLPPGDEMLLFCPGLLGGPSPPNPALGNSGVREERPPPSPQEGILGSGAPLALGLPSPEAPQLVIIQPALEVVQGEAEEGIAAPGPDEEATSSWVAPPMQDQARTLTSRPALDTDIYLSLQELRDQDPAHAV